MPNKFHAVQFYTAGGLAFACILGYYFAPSEKSDVFSTTLTLLVGFIVGKFTNGFAGGRKGNGE